MSLEKYIREVVQYCQKNNLDLDNVLEYFRQVWYQEFAKDDPTKAGGNLSSMTKFPERETTNCGCGTTLQQQERTPEHLPEGRYKSTIGRD